MVADLPLQGTRQRVLMTADTCGGVWQYALELARALTADGDEVVLATFGGEPDAHQRNEAAAINGLDLRTSEYRLAWMCAPWDDVARGGEWLQRIAAEVKPDVIHLNDYSYGALRWDAPVLMVAHSCVLSWWQAVHGCPAPASWDRYARQVRAGLLGADRVVAPSRAMLDAVIRHYGALPDTAVIHNGRSVPASQGETREPLVLAAGRVWDAAKNLGALAHVAPVLEWPVTIAGDARSPDGERIELANVRMLGRLPTGQLAPWFRRASIYALPARYEPFGLSALEAALAGCALVLGEIDSLREVWDDAALFVEPGDDAALAHALTRLIRDADLRERFADRASRRAQRYSPQAMATAYRAAYDDLRQRHRVVPTVSPKLAAGAQP